MRTRPKHERREATNFGNLYSDYSVHGAPAQATLYFDALITA